jgi:hypothetical protein
MTLPNAPNEKQIKPVLPRVGLHLFQPLNDDLGDLLKHSPVSGGEVLRTV